MTLSAGFFIRLFDVKPDTYSFAYMLIVKKKKNIYRLCTTKKKSEALHFIAFFYHENVFWLGSFWNLRDVFFCNTWWSHQMAYDYTICWHGFKCYKKHLITSSVCMVTSCSWSIRPCIHLCLFACSIVLSEIISVSILRVGETFWIVNMYSIVSKYPRP